MIAARVDAWGEIIEARIVDSSGHARLDRAALDAVRRTRFRPALRDGDPVTSWVRIPVRFALR
jgi:protein TonB